NRRFGGSSIKAQHQQSPSALKNGRSPTESACFHLFAITKNKTKFLITLLAYKFINWQCNHHKSSQINCDEASLDIIKSITNDVVY
ncbi:hypothetical protein, partial [Yersinia rohdei]|uniref:hypothetical protein n=1 Tax=Yersinia rohdei TaxID=29485 RepID=UPI001E4D2B13